MHNTSTRNALLSLLLLVVLPPLSAQAQNSDELGDALSTIGRTYADNYAQPVTNALGANLNAGLLRTAEFGDTGLLPVIDVYAGVVAMGAFVPKSAESFRITENDEFESGGNTYEIDYPDNTDLPTAFGNEDFSGTADILDKDTQRKVDEVSLPPGLLNTSVAPLLVPQVGVGTALGTDAQLRYLPEVRRSGYGSVSFFGLSVRHSISQYIPLLPLNIAVQGTWQQLSISGTEGGPNSDKIADASGWALNAHASKDISVLPLTVYGGVQYERFGADLDYTFSTTVNGEKATSTIQFEQDAANNVRALAGITLSLKILRLNVDYALSSSNTVSAGVGFIL